MTTAVVPGIVGNRDGLEQKYLMIIDRIRGSGMPQEAEARIPAEVEAI